MDNFKLPTQINIFGTTYKVKKTKNLKTPDDDLADGICHKDLKLIEIDTLVAQDMLRETFLHEVIHGVVEELSLDQIIDGQLEEIICEAIPKIFCKIENQQITQQKKAKAAKKKKKTKKRKGQRY